MLSKKITQTKSDLQIFSDSVGVKMIIMNEDIAPLVWTY